MFTQPKSFGFAQFALMSSANLFQETPAYLAAAKGTNEGPDESDWMIQSMTVVRDSMRGADLRCMNKVALEFLEGGLNALGPTSQIADLFLWCRDLITRASAATMFGERDPFAVKPELVETLW
jgi:hypothetical protein